MIDFEKLKYLDMEVINRSPTPEEDKAFSAFLKKLRAKEAQPGDAAMPRTKKLRSLPAKRKHTRLAAK